MEVLKDSIFFINIVFALIVVFFERKRPVYTLFWITILLLTSFFGFLIYVFFGLKFYKKRKVTKFYSRTLLKNVYQLENYKVKLVEKRNQLTTYIGSTVGNKVTYLNNVLFFKDGQRYYDSMIEDIKGARETINIEFFIFKDDEVGKLIYDEVEKKSREGIKVRIIVDGMGSKSLSKTRKKSLSESGVDLQIFFPSYFPYIKIGNLRANYRDHRKLCVIDSLILYSGGLNIGKEYVGRGRLGYWRDTGGRIEGEAAIDADREFYIIWSFLKNRNLDIKTIDKSLRAKTEIISKNIEKYNINAIQLISSGPNYETRTLRDVFIKMIMEAKRSIYIQTPYFVPDDLVLDCLRIALASGIEIKIMIPSFPDHLFVQWANQSFAIELMRLGAEVYRYKKGFLHSKVIIIDGEIASFGSSNFDYRSFYQNFEINFVIYDVELIGYLRGVFFEDIEESQMMKLKEVENRKTSEKIKEALCRLISPVI